MQQDHPNHNRSGPTDAGLRSGGAWLAAGALVLVTALLMHPPPEAEAAAFMQQIAAEGSTWVVVHWLAAIGLSFLAMGALILLTARSGPSATPLTTSALALLVVGCLWTASTAVAEATTISTAAAAGDLATFEAWHAFAEGRAFGFAAVGLAIAALALGQAGVARSKAARIASRVVVPLGVASFVGFVLNGALGIAIGGPIWLVSAIIGTLWLGGLGVAIARIPAGTAHRGATHA